jgi:hypothetical protein
MSKELDQARKEVERAARSLSNIASLPQNVGDQVRWTHNGCVWTRKSDNSWSGGDGGTYESKHVASFEFEHLSRGTGDIEPPAVTPEMIDAFKDGWAVANVQEAYGHRVERGLRAVMAVLAR